MSIVSAFLPFCFIFFLRFGSDSCLILGNGNPNHSRSMYVKTWRLIWFLLKVEDTQIQATVFNLQILWIPVTTTSGRTAHSQGEAVIYNGQTASWSSTWKSTCPPQIEFFNHRWTGTETVNKPHLDGGFLAMSATCSQLHLLHDQHPRHRFGFTASLYPH